MAGYIFSVHFKPGLKDCAECRQFCGSGWWTDDPHRFAMKDGVLLIGHVVESGRFPHLLLFFADHGASWFVKLHNHTENETLAHNTLNRSESKKACRDVVLTCPSLSLSHCSNNFAPQLLLRAVAVQLESPPNCFKICLAACWGGKGSINNTITDRQQNRSIYRGGKQEVQS